METERRFQPKDIAVSNGMGFMSLARDWFISQIEAKWETDHLKSLYLPLADTDTYTNF